MNIFYWLIRLCLLVSLLSGCLGNVLTGAKLIYDRHNFYKKMDDFQLGAAVNRALFKDKLFKQAYCSIDVAVFNGDLLLAGHVPNHELRQEIETRLHSIQGYRRLFNEIAVGNFEDNTIEDNWITTQIRSNMIADSAIDPNQFKVVTTDKVVYLLGDVIPEQAAKVILIARQCPGVKRVVKLFRYYHLTDTA